jgi:hypothetical protein
MICKYSDILILCSLPVPSSVQNHQTLGYSCRQNKSMVKSPKLKVKRGPHNEGSTCQSPKVTAKSVWQSHRSSIRKISQWSVEHWLLHQVLGIGRESRLWSYVFWHDNLISKSSTITIYWRKVSICSLLLCSYLLVFSLKFYANSASSYVFFFVCGELRIIRHS